MNYYTEEAYDVIVIGAGHAGCEAGLAAARLGKKVAVMTMSLESVADMPCNPNIGGTGKGHLVREIDALGGEMALNIDKTFIQSRMLNTSKGPAIHSLRVQADKRKYHEEMKKVLEREPNLDLVENEITEIVTENGEVTGVHTLAGAYYPAKAVIIATGTFLNGTILMGELQFSSGPHGMKAAKELSNSLNQLGIKLRRFKTGTPARVARRSVNFDVMKVQPGDEEIIPFSFLNMERDYSDHKQENCYLTYTTPKTKEIIKANLHRSPMYSGEAHGVGPRYCPSLEDKIVRFPDHETHQIFLEPEGLTTDEMYVQGASSTLPVEVQKQMYESIVGLEKVKIMRSAYGIEYDCIDSTELHRNLEHKKVKHLFFAGQVNGSSGYEEAAAQGLMAGINAALSLDGKEPFILHRSDAYIGVLIDDLVTKGTNEPYRMMTSRCEYRLTLRQDNADLRLTQKGYDLGLVTQERYDLYLRKKKALEEERKRLEKTSVQPEESKEYLLSIGSTPLKTGVPMSELLKRPEVRYEDLAPLDPDRPSLPREIRRLVETEIKYEGYIKKQMAQVEQFKKLEHKSLEGIEDYLAIKGLKKEAAQKLNERRPESVGQASRISGVSPADINVLLIYLEMRRRTC